MTVNLSFNLDRPEEVGVVIGALRDQASKLRSQAEALDRCADAAQQAGIDIVKAMMAEAAPAEPRVQVQPVQVAPPYTDPVTPADVAARLQETGALPPAAAHPQGGVELTDAETEALLSQHGPQVGETGTPPVAPAAAPPAGLQPTIQPDDDFPRSPPPDDPFLNDTAFELINPGG